MHADEEDMDAINIVPLLDIMLVLLTIVLTTATFVASGHIPVDLAQSGAAAPAHSAQLVITMTEQRSYYINDQPASDLVTALAGHDRSTAVLLRADGHLSLQDFVNTVDAIKQQGFAKVNLEMRRP